MGKTYEVKLDPEFQHRVMCEEINEILGNPLGGEPSVDECLDWLRRHGWTIRKASDTSHNPKVEKMIGRFQVEFCNYLTDSHERDRYLQLHEGKTMLEAVCQALAAVEEL